MTALVLVAVAAVIPGASVAAAEPGEWRPTLPLFVNDPFSWVANVRPFTLKRTSQFRTKGPLALNSAKYAAEFNEVKALGALTNSTRTDAQTQLARFFSANPLPMMNRALREIAEDRRLSTAQEARLFAMSSMSSADALINCWDDKDRWSFWRPSPRSKRRHAMATRRPRRRATGCHSFRILHIPNTRRARTASRAR